MKAPAPAPAPAPGSDSVSRFLADEKQNPTWLQIEDAFPPGYNPDPHRREKLNIFSF